MSSTTGSSEAALHQRQNEPNSKEQIQKQRIVSHMNSDHRDSLSMFLVIYNKVPYTQAQTAQIEEIRLSGMTISTADYPDRAKSSRTNFFVPFEPALNGYEEARHKVVEMHKHCLKTLGQSDITIQEYRRPRGFSAFMFTVCLVTFIAFSRRSNFQPGSELYSRLLQYVPDFATFCYKIQPLVIGGMVIIHSIEAIHMSIYRLRPHNVAIGSRLWFLWVLNDFVEGFTALQRFDALVEEKRALKAQHKPNLRG
ncbi:integral membrane protein, putative [Talaromyces marneffei ATCC 18224]|uniref:Integral membrane protein, putative n=1 Tax=Talaromyces marneffei (strain ATCC 18224 / CBS 334.59 / QM 7333) TaxID=441960 RepID=B6QKN8_TALMQ|nr:integral membrane protein, putative [Talaromyces marneffei ATCC 18224]